MRRLKLIPVKDVFTNYDVKYPYAVKRWVKKIRKSKQWVFPPIDVIKLKGKKGKFMLMDGRHRFEVAKKLKMKKILAEIF